MKPREPQRVEGPCPNGGAYALGYFDETGWLIEVVEYDADDVPIARTYNSPRNLTVHLAEDEYDEEAERQGIGFRQPRRPSPPPPEPPPPDTP